MGRHARTLIDSILVALDTQRFMPRSRTARVWGIESKGFGQRPHAIDAAKPSAEPARYTWGARERLAPGARSPAEYEGRRTGPLTDWLLAGHRPGCGPLALVALSARTTSGLWMHARRERDR